MATAPREKTAKQHRSMQHASLPTDIPHAERPPEEPIIATPPEVRDPVPEVGRVPDEPPPVVIHHPTHNEFERVAARDAHRAMGDDGTAEHQPVRYYRVTRTSRLYLPDLMTELAAGSIISTQTHDCSPKGPIVTQGIPVEECGAPSIGPAPLTATGHMLLTAPVTPRSFDPAVGPALVPGMALVGPGFTTVEEADQAEERAMADAASKAAQGDGR